MINTRQTKVYKINRSVLLKRFIFLVLLPASLLIVTYKLVLNQSKLVVNQPKLVVNQPIRVQGDSPKKPKVKSNLDNINVGNTRPNLKTETPIPREFNSPRITSGAIEVKKSPSINQDSVRLIQPEDYNNLSNTKTNKPKTISYNTKPPDFKHSPNLDKIVKQVVERVDAKGLPTHKFSISLLDISKSKHIYAGYLSNEPRFPGSIVKLFWMVYLYGNYNNKILQENSIEHKHLKKMIQDSDNESSSLIVDKITKTESGESLSDKELNSWIYKRLAMNSFFQKAGYQNLNISQKVFPTSYQKNDSPSGRDLQIRRDEINPIRNYVTSYDIARLLDEIYTNKSISKNYSVKMKKLIERDLAPTAWEKKPFNSIEGFLGEGLPENVEFYSKMGWNSRTRNDAAIVISPDKKHKYILVVMGDDPSFFQDKKLFPEISRIIYMAMTSDRSSP
ncbi:serine hydrolase [Cylindrospermopsis raciborskii]|nr:serine hydrolase [Cylindrospermopsis raciborskii]